MSEKEEYTKFASQAVYNDAESAIETNAFAGYGSASDPNRPEIEPSPNSGEYSTSMNVPARLLAPFCYLLVFISATIVIIMERKSDYVLFHAWQSLILFFGLATPVYLFFIIITWDTVAVIWISLYCIFSAFLLYRSYIDVDKIGGGFKVPGYGKLADKCVDSCCLERRLTQRL